MTCQIRRHVRQPVRRSWSLGITDLSLSKDLVRCILNCRIRLIDDPVSRDDLQRSNNQHRVHSIECKRLDEHGDGGIVYSVDPIWIPHGGANVPGMQAEPEDDHGGEEAVERKRNRNIGKAKAVGNRGPGWGLSRGLEYEYQDTHRCIDDVSSECHRRCVGFIYAPKEPR